MYKYNKVHLRILSLFEIRQVKKHLRHKYSAISTLVLRVTNTIALVCVCVCVCMCVYVCVCVFK